MDFVETAEKLGVSVAVLSVILAIAAWIARRLFSEKNGILTRIAEKHVEVMEDTRRGIDRLATGNERLAVANESLAESSLVNNDVLTNLCSQHQDRKSPFATAGLVEAAMIGLEIVEEEHPHHKTRTEAMRRELTRE